MNKTVENYFVEGCGRCPLGGTTDCKVHLWMDEMKYLRNLAIESGLKEECKWGVPCYTLEGKNVLMVSAFKKYCAISFFKGALLKNNLGLLEKPGKHSQASRLIKFVNVEDVIAVKADLMKIISEAIVIEKSGQKVEYKADNLALPEELEIKFAEDLAFQTAFEALTPGKQRGYLIYFTAAKQSKTRRARIEKHSEKILRGEGLHDKYKRSK